MQQRVRHRDDEDVEVEPFEEPRDHVGLVDAGPDRAYVAGAPELLERPHAAGLERVEVRAERLLVNVMAEVEVVHEHDVHVGQAQPLQAVLVRAHDGVVAVVEDALKRQSARPGA
jgi:hypothetical protein